APDLRARRRLAQPLGVADDRRAHPEALEGPGRTVHAPARRLVEAARARVVLERPENRVVPRPCQLVLGACEEGPACALAPAIRVDVETVQLAEAVRERARADGRKAEQTRLVLRDAAAASRRRLISEEEAPMSTAAPPETTITDHEHQQVDRANASGLTPVVFVHGLWLLPSSWDNWAQFFDEAGYASLTPGWPDDPETVEEA